MLCIGYYLITPAPRPTWCAMRAKQFLSISSGIGVKHPDPVSCCFARDPNTTLRYAAQFGLDQAAAVRLRQVTLQLLRTGQLTDTGRFPSYADARGVYRMMNAAPMLHLVGAWASEGTVFRLAEAGFFPEGGASPALYGAKPLGAELLAPVTMGNSHWLDTYLEDHLDTTLSRHYRLAVDPETGLLQNDARSLALFSYALTGMGEQPAWHPVYLADHSEMAREGA